MLNFFRKYIQRKYPQFEEGSEEEQSELLTKIGYTVFITIDF